MKMISLKLTEALEERLSAVAQERGGSRSAVVREALEAYLKNEKEIRPGSCLEMARDLIGIIKGPPDLSYHKRHMKGFGK